MKLVINAVRNTSGGGLQVALSFIRECIDIPGNEYEVWTNPGLQAVLCRTVFPSNFKFRVVPRMSFFRMGQYLSDLENESRPDVVFSVFGPAYWRPKAPHLTGFAQGHYIYPESPFWKMISWRQKLFWQLKKRIHLSYLKRDSDAIVCETSDARNRIERLLGNGKKYFTVSNTYGTHFLNATSFEPFEEIPDWGAGTYKLLTVANFYPHKNISVIKPVVDMLLRKGITRIRFILTITPEEYERMFKGIYRSYVCTVGTVSPDRCPALYAGCDAVFLPSLIECFSANYPEAMVMKKPVLTSDLGFARSVCGEAALYFDPLSASDIVRQIERLSGDENLRLKLIRSGLQRIGRMPDAKTRAERYLHICELLGKRKS